MRIGLFTDTYLPVRSGMELAIETVRLSLEKMGHELHVFATTMYGYHDENANVVRFHSMRVIRNPEVRLAFPWPVARRLKEVVRIPLDIVHAHSPATLGFVGLYVARSQKIPLVYTNHTDFAEYAKVYFRIPILSPFVARKLVTWFANKSDCVIVPSYKYKTLLEQYGVHSRLVVLQTGINVSRFTPTHSSRHAASAIRAQWNIPEKAKTLLYVGRINEEKNVDFLIRAFTHIRRSDPNTYLLLVGDGRSLNKYTRLVQLLGARNVIFTGVVPHADMPLYYQASDVFLFASRTDTQGLVILEAMASGLPIVALEDDALKDVLHHNVNGLFVDITASPDIFASKVLDFLNAPETYARISAAGPLTAAQYSQEKQAAKLEAIYKELISAQASAAIDSPLVSQPRS